MRAPSLLAVLILLVLCSLQPDAAAASRVHHHRFGREKLTTLHFYLHDTLSGKDPTAVLVAHGANATSRPGDPTPFGSVYATDDVLTEGPERASRVVGSAQGLYVSSGKDGRLSLVMGMDFEFSDYNGSSFVVFSRNPVTNDHRELAVVGGRGKFRMARGFAVLRTHYLDTGNGDAIIEYNVTLLHY
ncbi:dirigent protein 4-like [Lolium rigidum]|uniref:dirigent protein 4-like n=1 Tax=Lolium rigidum TaxID=89674 RepID=UPI001F5DD44E|nr:dirigent protein 4-like [Lolium rigidum]